MSSSRPSSSGRRAILGGTAALAMMAGGHARAADAGVIADATPLQAVTVKGKRPKPLEHRTGGALAAGAIKDTPQAISVVDQKLMKDQGVTSLQQALRNVPGITVAIGEGGTLSGDQFKVRGFDANNDIYLDGLRDFGVYTRDSFDDQAVEVLKGPSGAMFGRGTTGGVINTVSKTPGPMSDYDVSAVVGSGKYYRATADLNMPINASTAFRLNLMANSNHVVGRDLTGSARWGVAAALGFGIGGPTSVTLGYFHQDDRRRPDYGIVIIQPPGGLIAKPATEYGLPRDTFTGFAADKDHTHADIVTVRLAHDVAPGVSFASDSRLGVYSRAFQYTTVDQCSAACTAAFFDGDPATIPYGGIGGGGPYDQHAWGVQNISALTAEFRLGGLRNKLVAGWDVSYQDNRKTFAAYSLPPGIAARNLIPVNLLDPSHAFPAGYAVITPPVLPAANTLGQPGTNITSGTYIVRANGSATDLAAFATDRLWFTDQISVIGGFRFDHYPARYSTVDVRAVASQFSNTSNLVDPRVSLVFEPTPDQTWYVSWSKAATPVGTAIVGTANPITAATQAFEPDKSESWEAGAKLAFLDGRLALTGAIFDISKSNAKQVDPVTGEISAQSSQRQRVRGGEAAITGQITGAWSVNLAYTYLDSTILEDLSCGGTPVVCNLNPFTVGRPVVYAPKNAATLWTSYEVMAVPGLSLGGGITYQDHVYLQYATAGTAPNPTALTKIAEVPHTLSLDAMIAYQIGETRIALNAYNLTDRLNYSQVFANRGVPAPGRSFAVTLSTGF